MLDYGSNGVTRGTIPRNLLNGTFRETIITTPDVAPTRYRVIMITSMVTVLIALLGMPQRPCKRSSFAVIIIIMY